MNEFALTYTLPPVVNVFTVWLLGVSLGLTACTVTCLPFMGTWVLARGTLWRDTGSFLLGRLAAYGLLGLIAGLAGTWLTGVLKHGIGNAVLGAAAVGAGVWLLWGEKRRSCAVARGAEAPPFALGFALSLTPCAPLASLLTVCAQGGSAMGGMGYGLAFGLGAAVTPLLIVLPWLGGFGRQLRSGRPWLGVWLRCLSGAVLIALGLRRLLLLM